MNAIPLTVIYDDITRYYRNTHHKELIFDALDDTPTIKCNGIVKELNPPDEDEALIGQDEAYRIFESDDKKDTTLETIRNYLGKHFAYLMQYVFYLNLKQFRMGKTYAIPEQDVPIVKEILLRSVSQHEFDLIIGKWLKGEIADNAYSEIVELSNRLFHLINNIDGVEPERKKRWITALRIALRYDLAYAITETEYVIRGIFEDALPFVPHGDGFDPKIVHQEQITETILNCLHHLGKQAQDESVKAVYQYLQSADFERITSPEAFPPVELMEMKSICEHLFENEQLTKQMPNADHVTAFTEYFISVDKSYQEKLKARKKTDRKRYERKKEEGKD